MDEREANLKSTEGYKPSTGLNLARRLRVPMTALLLATGLVAARAATPDSASAQSTQVYFACNLDVRSPNNIRADNCQMVGNPGQYFPGINNPTNVATAPNYSTTSQQCLVDGRAVPCQVIGNPNTVNTLTNPNFSGFNFGAVPFNPGLQGFPSQLPNPNVPGSVTRTNTEQESSRFNANARGTLAGMPVDVAIIGMAESFTRTTESVTVTGIDGRPVGLPPGFTPMTPGYQPVPQFPGGYRPY